MKKIIISMFLIMAAGILVSCGKSKEEMDSYLVLLSESGYDRTCRRDDGISS